MKFWEIFRFELAYRLRRASTWIFLGAFLLLTFSMLENVMIQEARASGNVNANAPFAVAFSIMAVGIMGVAMTAAIFAEVATRDVQSRMDALFFTAPIRKVEYLGARFFAALTINAALLLAVPAGLVIGPELFGVDRSLFGPFRFATYAGPYFSIGLTNLFISAAIIYAAAALSRKAVAGFAAGLLLFLTSIIGFETLGKSTAYRDVAALIDPFGFTAFEAVTAYWTPAERNVQLLGLEGVLLWNRVIWIALAAGVLGVLYIRFKFSHEGRRPKRRREARTSAPIEAPVNPAPVIVPRVQEGFDLPAQLRQMAAVAGRSFRETALSRSFAVVLTAGLAFLFINGWDAGYVLDTPAWPVTYVVARGVLGDLTIFIYIALGLYAGEVVWMERDSGVNDIIDSAPVPNWALLVGKFAALVLVLLVAQTVLLVGGIGVQALQGYYDFDLAVWAQILFGFQLVDYVLIAAVAMLIHVLTDQKYLAHLIFILYIGDRVFRFTAKWLDLEHNLLHYGGDAGWSHSDISGFEPFLAPYFWFNLYWVGWALLLAIVANLFWVRSRETRLGFRFRLAGRRFTGLVAGTAAAAAFVILTTGGFIFYNTNVLNEYRPRSERIALLVQYEQRYKRYQRTPQPQVAGSKLHIEIYPSDRAAVLRGSYLLRNTTAEEIDSLHLVFDPAVEVRTVDFDRPATGVVVDNAHDYHIYALDDALAAGESLQVSFELAFAARGFPNEGIDASVVSNGTYINHDWLPAIGYQTGRELKSAHLRKENGLPPREGTPSVHDEEARRRSPQNAEWFHSEAVIGTDEDQVAVASGTLKRTWTENGRRYFHYVTDAPIKNVYAFLSAEYAVRKARWEDVDIEIFYHPKHTFNLDAMVQSARASLAYFSEHFGPYPHKQLRIVELPRHHGNFARAFPNLVAYSEGFGFIARAENGINYPFAVTAHEVAHQWWGGQFAPAEVKGRRVLYETLAHYSALMVLEHAYGPAQVRRFLDLMTHRYLVGRQNREGSEAPLLRSDDQDYIHYDKGAVVMHSLKEYVGESAVNEALGRFLDRHRFGGPQYPTTLDLYEELLSVTPDSLRYLLTDLFEDITLWELRTTDVGAEPAEGGSYQVTLQVEGYKLKADSIGRDHRVPMNDYVEVGVYAAPDDGEDDEEGEQLYLRKHQIRSGEQTISVTVPKKPARAGIDPRRLLLERQRGDNFKKVQD